MHEEYVLAPPKGKWHSTGRVGCVERLSWFLFVGSFIPRAIEVLDQLISSATVIRQSKCLRYVFALLYALQSSYCFSGLSLGHEIFCMVVSYGSNTWQRPYILLRNFRAVQPNSYVQPKHFMITTTGFIPLSALSARGFTAWVIQWWMFFSFHSRSILFCSPYVWSCVCWN